jgi:hypothetical protein
LKRLKAKKTERGKIDKNWKFDYFDYIDNFGQLIQSDQKINKVENLMTYFNDYLIRNSIWSRFIHFDPFWTDLMIYFNDYFITNPIWTSLIHFFQKINIFENPMIYFNDYFIRNPIWSSLIHFGQTWFNRIRKKIKLKFWWYISMIISSEIKFDQVWSIMINFGQIWFNLIKKMKIWWYISMIISSEIENVEKVENLTKKIAKPEKHFKSFR